MKGTYVWQKTLSIINIDNGFVSPLHWKSWRRRELGVLLLRLLWTHRTLRKYCWYKPFHALRDLQAAKQRSRKA